MIKLSNIIFSYFGPSRTSLHTAYYGSDRARGGWREPTFPAWSLLFTFACARPFGLPSSLSLSGVKLEADRFDVNSRSPSTFPPPTRGGAIAQSSSAYINPPTLQGEDISTLVSHPLFGSLDDRQHKNTIHPFPPFPRFCPI